MICVRDRTGQHSETFAVASNLNTHCRGLWHRKWQELRHFRPVLRGEPPCIFDSENSIAVRSFAVHSSSGNACHFNGHYSWLLSTFSDKSSYQPTSVDDKNASAVNIDLTEAACWSGNGTVVLLVVLLVQLTFQKSGSDQRRNRANDSAYNLSISP